MYKTINSNRVQLICDECGLEVFLVMCRAKERHLDLPNVKSLSVGTAIYAFTGGWLLCDKTGRQLCPNCAPPWVPPPAPPAPSFSYRFLVFTYRWIGPALMLAAAAILLAELLSRQR